MQQGGGLRKYLPCKVDTLTSTIVSSIRSTLFWLQLTWVPNEIVGKDLVLFEFADRVAEPKGWFYKLWETLSPQSIVVVVASRKWDRSRISNFIRNW